LEAASAVVLGAYEKLLREGKVDARVGNDPLTALKRLEKDGKRFDLAFLDPDSCSDKKEYLMVVQKLLRKGGCAYIPLTWWRPKSLGGDGGGVDEKVVWSGYQGDERLEDYLVRTYPDRFEITNFPGAKTLVIKGT